MADGDRFDLVLFGYRNDLARARTHDYLAQHPLAAAGPPGAPLPQRVCTGLDAETAQSLCTALEGLGAQVGVLPSTERAAAAAPPAPPPAERRVLTPTMAGLVLVVTATAVLLIALTPPARSPSGQTAPPAEAVLELLRAVPGGVNPQVAHLNQEALELADAGKFEEAVERLQRARRLAPTEPLLTRNLQTVLLNWGSLELAADRLDAAEDRLERAAALGDREEVQRALGVLYMKQAEYGRATAALEHALDMAPQDPHALLALAEAYLKQEKRPEALALLQRAQEVGLRIPGLDKRVQQLSREVDAEWDFTHLNSTNFRISFGDDEDRHAAVHPVLDALEDAYRDVGRKFGYYPDTPTAVVLYAQRDFHSVTQTPDWAGAAFDGRIKLPVRGLRAGDPDLRRVVRHEYAHSLVARLAGPRCPVWLNEGLAVWAEEEREGEREAWADQRIAGRELFTLEQLQGSFTKLPADRVEVAYAQSYLAVRLLVDHYGTHDIATLLRTIPQTAAFYEAFAAVYPGDLASFEQDLLRVLGG